MPGAHVSCLQVACSRVSSVRTLQPEGYKAHLRPSVVVACNVPFLITSTCPSCCEALLQVGLQIGSEGCLHCQVYKAVLNRTQDVAVKTFIHQGSDPEVIRFNAVSCCHHRLAPCTCDKGPYTDWHVLQMRLDLFTSEAV